MKKIAVLAFIGILALPALSVTFARAEPERVTVQHILIAFKGSLPDDTKVTRSREDAEKLALQVFERAKAGEDFAAMVKMYTNDSYPGIYKMTNKGVTPDKSKQEYSRTGMVQAFGDVSFSLEVGGVGLAVYDPATSKYGWHIIKRLE
ncbi:MAG: peptidylprolyl isomerase [Candidatus Aminicenantes bacterium]|nr:peptidylprolyl isomerase [Candidatus Aminicenantes bacterium]